jgi:hypothetical protein
MLRFEHELGFFIAHQEELVRKYNGKVLVIKGDEVIGVYDTPIQAYQEAQKEHELGTFMIQPCRPGPEAYTVVVSSTALLPTQQHHAGTEGYTL